MISFLKKLVRMLGFEVLRTQTWEAHARRTALADLVQGNRVDVLSLVIESIKDSRHPFFFVQVGANDGATDDPVGRIARERGWSGILIEPQPDAFKRLKQNYTDTQGFSFENVAIATDQSGITLYRFVCLKTGERPQDLFASADRNRLVQARKRFGWDFDIEEVHVPAMSLDDVLSKHNVSIVDLLLVDTEGMDFEVIRTLDFGRVAPRIIQFEHIHLSSTDLANCLGLLRSQGYEFALQDRDVIAMLAKGLPASSAHRANVLATA